MKTPLLALGALLFAAAANATPETATRDAAAEALYEQHCATCHANPATRSPTLASLQ